MEASSEIAWNASEFSYAFISYDTDEDETQ